MESFVNGLSNAHRSVFYPNPDYVRSSIFINPNALSNIKLPAKESAKPKVPPGIRSPNTFLEVGKYLLHLLVLEIENRSDTFLSQWKDKPAAFTKAYQFQFIAYAQGTFPFNPPLGAGQPLLEWLLQSSCTLMFRTPWLMNGQHLSQCLIPLNKARKKVDYHCHGPGSWLLSSRERCSAPAKLPLLPTVRIFDVKRLLRSIDDDERDDDPNYDESDDVPSFRTTTASPSAPSSLSEPSNSLPGEGDTSKLDFTSPIVIEILGDGPMVKKGKPSMASKASVVEEEIGGTFDLQEWV
ncbi:hypothetical protein CPB83DRAFT_893142 [Crepidotus variabilis]|uniref:Uncharacterized protein n=1 Tax=Crepidotus variabilis TaxID=179855 RepID=A0A9P6EJD1_9AGAR|nr:hypothetical protein CPB83DRAFT_893142 [Crepidotus variabilis]